MRMVRAIPPGYTGRPRGCGGIGRRARFRSVWASARGGSSPLIRITQPQRIASTVLAMRSVGAAVIGVCALCAICAGVARATVGGGSIASAKVAAAGVQEAGTTASFKDTCQNGYEFWSLHLTQGDLVKI